MKFIESFRAALGPSLGSQWKFRYFGAKKSMLGGSCHDLYVVNNHGDRKSPKGG